MYTNKTNTLIIFLNVLIWNYLYPKTHFLENIDSFVPFLKKITNPQNPITPLNNSSLKIIKKNKIKSQNPVI